MKVVYGSYEHDPNTVTMSRLMIRQLYSPRHEMYGVEYTMELNGQLIVNDPSITTPDQLQDAQMAKISALIDAYKWNYHDLKFLHDDGEMTRHSMINADSLSGVQVIHRSWPEGNAAEYATIRSYSITLQAIYDAADSQLISYNENFIYIGNCGPRWVMTDTWNGPNWQLQFPRTHQRMIQTGSAIGYSGYPLVHMNSFYPEWEHQDRREVTVGHPERFKNGFRFFPLKWVMHHSLPTYNQGVPIMR